MESLLPSATGPAPAITAPPAPVAGTAHASTAALPPPFPSSEGTSLKPVAAGMLLVALAVAALLAARRRKRVPRHVEILESSSLGPKRSLVVARMGDELLLLGSCEGGITLLTTRPARALTAAAEEPAPGPVSTAAVQGGPTRFELILGESADDVELRRKLAAGAAGSVR
jgi:flagellar protein FliO/FliZ